MSNEYKDWIDEGLDVKPIVIKKNIQGDTRSAQGEVDFETFQKSNDMHIQDVNNIMQYLAEELVYAGVNHDRTKKRYEKQFYREFTDSRKNNWDFSESAWYKKHIEMERHHINSRVPKAVNLIDVLEMIADCTAAGLARSGNVRPIEIDKDVLYEAFKNTCQMVEDVCVLEE